MTNMKRVLCLLFSLCMIISVLPMSAFAASDEQGVLFSDVVSGTDPWSDPDAPDSYFEEDALQVFGATEGAWTALAGSGAVMYSAETETEDTSLTTLTVGDLDALTTTYGEGWSFDAETSTLTLSGTNIVGEEFGIYAVGDLTIELAENTQNTVFANIYGIYVEGNLTIHGGSLKVESTAEEGAAIAATGNILIQDCSNIVVSAVLVGILAPVEKTNVTISGSCVELKSELGFTEAMELGTPCPPAGTFAASMLIEDNSEVTVSSNGVGLYIMYSLQVISSEVEAESFYFALATTDMFITNSSIEAESTISLTEALDLGMGMPPCALYGDHSIVINNNSDVTAKGEYVGIFCARTLDENTVNISKSNVVADALYIGLGASHLAIDESNVTTVANATFEDMEKEQVWAASGIYTFCAEITDSVVDARSNVMGILADYSGAVLTIDNSDVNATGGYIALGSITALTVTNSDIVAEVTLPIEDALEYASISEINGPPSGLFMLAGSGTTSIANSNVTVDGAWCGIGADIVDIDASVINITGGGYGIMGGGTLTIDDCEEITIQNDQNMIDAYVDAGGTSSEIPAAITATGSTRITNCSGIDLSGNWTGIYSRTGTVTVKNTDAAVSGGAFGIAAIYLELNNSNIQADAVWTEEEAAIHECPLTTALAGENALTLTDAYVDHSIDRYEDGGTYIALNEDGSPAASVKVIALGASGDESDEEDYVASGSCGNNVNWILSKNGTIRIFAQTASTMSTFARSIASEDAYVMEDFESPEDAPWNEYRDQITAVIVDDEVVNIGKNAFAGCKNLTQVTVGNSVTTIGESAFSGCTDLQDVDLGESVAEIEENAFASCGTVTVNFSGNCPENVSENAFEDSNATVTYPKENDTWKDEESVSSLGNNVVVEPQPEAPCSNGHKMGAWVVVKEATCTTEGFANRTCKYCDACSVKEIEKIDHTGAEAVKENEFSATCEENGSYDMVVYCSVCEKELSREIVVVSATGHNYEDGFCTKCQGADPDYQPSEPSEDPTEPSEKPTEPSEKPSSIFDRINKLIGKLFGSAEPEDPTVPPEGTPEPDTGNSGSSGGCSILDQIGKLISRLWF